MTLNEVLWAIVLFAGLALEVIGLMDRRDRWLPLSDYINRWVPPALIAAALIWLAHHFGLSP
jgi:hypothetical protein